MMPSSDQLEAFFERLKNLGRELSNLKGAEVRKAETIVEIKAVSKGMAEILGVAPFSGSPLAGKSQLRRRPTKGTSTKHQRSHAVIHLLQ